MADSFQDQVANVIVKALIDQNTYQQLKNQPKKVLSDNGIILSEKVRVNVVENGPEDIYIVIPYEKLPEARKVHKISDTLDYLEIGNFVIGQVQNEGPHAKELLKSPKEALIKMGVSIPKEYTIHLLEEKQDQRYIVLPDQSGTELTEAELSIIGGASKGGGPSPEQAPDYNPVPISIETAAPVGTQYNAPL